MTDSQISTTTDWLNMACKQIELNKLCDSKCSECCIHKSKQLICKLRKL